LVCGCVHLVEIVLLLNNKNKEKQAVSTIKVVKTHKLKELHETSPKKQEITLCK